MQEQDERISARLENKMIDEIDALVKEEKYSNRSDFLRTAVRTQIDTQQQKDAIPVVPTKMVLKTIDKLVERGYYHSREDALDKAINGFFTDENMRKVITDADLMEIIAGSKVEANLESSTSRQVITK